MKIKEINNNLNYQNYKKNININKQEENINNKNKLIISLSCHNQLSISYNDIIAVHSIDSIDSSVKEFSHDIQYNENNTLSISNKNMFNAFDISMEMKNLVLQGYAFDSEINRKLFGPVKYFISDNYILYSNEKNTLDTDKVILSLQNYQSKRYLDLEQLWTWIGTCERIRNTLIDDLLELKNSIQNLTHTFSSVASGTAPMSQEVFTFGFPYHVNEMPHQIGIISLLFQNINKNNDEKDKKLNSSKTDANLLHKSNDTTDQKLESSFKFDKGLGCKIYTETMNRKLVLLLCNYDPDFNDLIKERSSNRKDDMESNQQKYSNSTTRGGWSVMKTSHPQIINKNIEFLNSNSGIASGFSNGKKINQCFNLRTILDQYEKNGQFEKAMMISIFHGKLRLCIQILENYKDNISFEIDFLDNKVRENNFDKNILEDIDKESIDEIKKNIHYLQTKYSLLQLVGMAIAGYRKSAVSEADILENDDADSMSLWLMMCQKLLSKEEILSPSTPPPLPVFISPPQNSSGANNFNREGSLTPRYLYAIVYFLCTMSQLQFGLNYNSLKMTKSSSFVDKSTHSGYNNDSNSRNYFNRTKHHNQGNFISKKDSDDTSDYNRKQAENFRNNTLVAFSPILHDESLPFLDRIGFATRYLNESELFFFINKILKDYTQTGSILTIILTGFVNPNLLVKEKSDQTMKILKNYLDKTSDIQTIFLVIGRLPSFVFNYYNNEKNLLDIYYELLNKWKLWFHRAKLDVERGNILEKYKYIDNVFINNENLIYGNHENKNSLSNSSTVESVDVPPQLFVRCNFCGNSISLLSLLQSNKSSINNGNWSNRTKAKLNFCPSCKKSLPQCCLCLLPYGTINPYYEITQQQTQKSKNCNNVNNSSITKHEMQSKTENESSASRLNHLEINSFIPFKEWISWCIKCKHGGHSHHLYEWFQIHDICPVTGCDCTCQKL